MNIRKATLADVSEVISLFTQTVLHATIRDYDEAQRRAWAKRGADEKRWQNRIVTQYFLVAEQLDQLIGMGSVTTNGHLDILYVHDRFQRQGVATRLINELEAYAKVHDLVSITTDASVTARSFFERKGYRILREQQNTLGAQRLINYRMEKTL